jgi:hypothetical protein
MRESEPSWELRDWDRNVAALDVRTVIMSSGCCNDRQVARNLGRARNSLADIHVCASLKNEFKEQKIN